MTQYVPMLKGELKDRIIVMEDPPNAMNETYSEVLSNIWFKLTNDAIFDPPGVAIGKQGQSRDDQWLHQFRLHD